MSAIRPILAAAALLASACSKPEPASQPEQPSPANASAGAPSPASPALTVDGGGLSLATAGSERRLAFGAARDAVADALSGRGPGRSERLEECGAGPLDQLAWDDGLSLYFQDGVFAGWSVASPRESGAARLATSKGITLGSTRAELDSAYRPEVMESSLGTEFSAGGLSGLLSGPEPGARVTHLWAGATCIMR